MPPTPTPLAMRDVLAVAEGAVGVRLNEQPAAAVES
jgi:hypothetical protein